MPRDQRAYLADIVDSCVAIQSDSESRSSGIPRKSSRSLLRQREFIIIGEAIAALARIAPAVFGAITRARRIVDFRNQLTHEYPTVDDALVWAIIETDVPILRRESAELINRHTSGDEES